LGYRQLNIPVVWRTVVIQYSQKLLIRFHAGVRNPLNVVWIVCFLGDPSEHAQMSAINEDC
jgi:hypothetical protein